MLVLIPVFMLCVSTLFVASQDEEMMFLSEYLDSRCPLSDEVDINAHTTCLDFARNIYESRSLVNYYKSAMQLNDDIGKALDDPNWRNEIEGHSLSFHEKINLIQRLANNVRVRTICEVGFNAGYSALNFLMSNHNATVISFDIFYWKYSSVANIALNNMFPKRHFITIAGDSKHSIPMFEKTLRLASKRQEVERSDGNQGIGENTPLCNLIFIDGGHTREAFLSDLMSMRTLADPEYHTVLIDDFHMSIINDAYYELEAKQIVYNTKVIDSMKQYVYAEWEEKTDGSVYFDLMENPGINGDGIYDKGAVATCQYVF